MLWGYNTTKWAEEKKKWQKLLYAVNIEEKLIRDHLSHRLNINGVFFFVDKK